MPIKKENFVTFTKGLIILKTMKKLIILFFSIFALFSYSQEDFKKIIAQNTCKCVKDVKKENLTKKQIEFQFVI